MPMKRLLRVVKSLSITFLNRLPVSTHLYAHPTVKARVHRCSSVRELGHDRTNTDDQPTRSTGGPNRRPLISLRGNPQPVTVFTHM